MGLFMAYESALGTSMHEWTVEEVEMKGSFQIMNASENCGVVENTFEGLIGLLFLRCKSHRKRGLSILCRLHITPRSSLRQWCITRLAFHNYYNLKATR